MNGGLKTALLISCLTVSGCTSAPQVKVRSLADPAAALRGGDSVGLARGQLMLGNVGLALEGFRKALRENPYDPKALQGIGDCYSAMSRFDLAQSNYEAALALSPRDPRLLLGLAAIYEREGKTARAMIARAEALTTDTVSGPKTTPAPVAMAATLAPRPSVGSITVQLPAARPAEHLEAQASAAPMPELAPAEAPAINLPPPAPAVADELPIPSPAVRSVKVELPLAKPIEHLEARVDTPPLPPIEDYQPSNVTVPLPPSQPAPAPLPRRDVTAPVLDALAPRLERLSRGEVALITTSQPIWRSSATVRTASGTTVRWVALASASGRPNVRILNAARSQGLAASARTVLSDRGWRKLAIGDAPTVLRKSVVLYPKGREALGRRLAAQFGVTAQVAQRDDVVLVLGRDAVDRIARPRRS